MATAHPQIPARGATGGTVSAAAPVYLGVAQTSVERRLLRDWIAKLDHGPASRPALLDAADTRLEDRLAAAGTAPVVPLKVVWLPRERDGQRVATWVDLLKFTNPWQPDFVRQRRIRRYEPDRIRIVDGEPAPADELRRLWEASGAETAFGPFVVSRAVLALERAERLVTGYRYKMPRETIVQIETDPKYRSSAEKLATDTGKPLTDVRQQLRSCLGEMDTQQTRFAIDIFYGQLGGLMTRGFEVEFDRTRVEQLRELNRRHALVFLPAHKSYVDPVLLGRELQKLGFPANHAMGGANLNFWPLGPLAKRAGVVYIRRSFRDDPVYKLALRSYIAFLVRKRFNLEWYIEGGRSRTGKLRPPRLGILRYLVDAFRLGEVEDVYLVPVAIAFDQIFELAAMAAEARGAPKKAEGVGWLLQYARDQGADRARAWIRIGEPLSLGASLENAGRGVKDPARAVELGVQKTAFEVSHRINRVTPITPTSLVTLALLGVEDRWLTMPEIRATLEPLLEYVRARGLPTAGDLGSCGEWLPRAIDVLMRQGVVARFDRGAEPVYGIDQDQHLIAAFYRNNAIHFFVTRAIVEVIAVRAAERGLDFARCWQGALELRDLMKFEFFFPSRGEFRAEVQAELTLLEPDWAEHVGRPETMRAVMERQHLHLAHRVLRSFLEAYQVVADRLCALPVGAKFDEKAFLADCLGVAQQYRLQHRIWSSESVSKELFATGLDLARNRGLVEARNGDAEGLAARRRAFATEIADEVRRIAVIRDLAMRDLRARLVAGASTPPAELPAPPAPGVPPP
jgi:glycerol-3-phosphate O-acyltransferase